MSEGAGIALVLQSTGDRPNKVSTFQITEPAACSRAAGCSGPHLCKPLPPCPVAKEMANCTPCAPRISRCYARQAAVRNRFRQPIALHPPPFQRENPRRRLCSLVPCLFCSRASCRGVAWLAILGIVARSPSALLSISPQSGVHNGSRKRKLAASFLGCWLPHTPPYAISRSLCSKFYM